LKEADTLRCEIHKELKTEKIQSFVGIVLGGGSLSRASRFAVAKKIEQNKMSISHYSE